MGVIEEKIFNTETAFDVIMRSTATNMPQSYFDLSLRAFQQTQSGEKSYMQAIKEAVSDLTSQDVHTATYTRKGVRRDPIDVAVRRNVLTNLAQAAGALQLESAEELGTDLVEVSAHAGARPTHAVWQGGVYSISGKTEGYEKLEDATGYGEITGLCGINCRHTFYPYIEGVSTRNYTDTQLRELMDAEVSYDGERIPLYEATQEQRAIERGIRDAKRQLMAADELAKFAKTDEDKKIVKDWFDDYARRLNKSNDELKSLLEQTGLPAYADRTQVSGFGQSLAQRARRAR